MGQRGFEPQSKRPKRSRMDQATLLSRQMGVDASMVFNSISELSQPQSQAKPGRGRAGEGPPATKPAVSPAALRNLFKFGPGCNGLWERQEALNGSKSREEMDRLDRCPGPRRLTRDLAPSRSSPPPAHGEGRSPGLPKR